MYTTINKPRIEYVRPETDIPAPTLVQLEARIRLLEEQRRILLYRNLELIEMLCQLARESDPATQLRIEAVL